MNYAHFLTLSPRYSWRTTYHEMGNVVIIACRIIMRIQNYISLADWRLNPLHCNDGFNCLFLSPSHQQSFQPFLSKNQFARRVNMLCLCLHSTSHKHTFIIIIISFLFSLRLRVLYAKIRVFTVRQPFVGVKRLRNCMMSGIMSFHARESMSNLNWII